MTTENTKEDPKTARQLLLDELKAIDEQLAEEREVGELNILRARVKEQRKLLELERTHGPDKIRHEYTNAGLFVFARLSEAAANRFQDELFRDGKPKEKAQRQRKAAQQLARDCCLYPDPIEREQRFEEYPNLPAELGAVALKHAGEVLEDAAGK